jgi:glycosyltransferase involved in cell wall biosynthesis
MNESILTAIIFTYNQEDTIERCIKSIAEQKTDYKYEIQIYDDCSMDKNAEICQKYAQLYPEKIKFFRQKENTFLMPYKKTQSYKAIQGIDTKYFCIIEGDDYWCDENKLQIALDFLENNPQYIGFAHDTLQVNEYDGTERSWVHDLAKYDIKNPITFNDNFIFIMSCSRIFRNCNFKEVGIWPVDYLVYNYHLEKGPIYYCDKIMATYTYGNNGTFASLGTKKIQDMNGMFAYKVSKILGFRHDDICTKMQEWYDKKSGAGKEHYNRLLKFKKLFGFKLGWNLWFIHRFVLEYGFESMNLNYVYPRKSIKKHSDKQFVQKKQLKVQLEDLDEKYKIYCEKGSGSGFTLLMEDVIQRYIQFLSYSEVEALIEKYPKFHLDVPNLFYIIISKFVKKDAKYNRRRRMYIALISALSILNATLLVVIFSGVLK